MLFSSSDEYIHYWLINRIRKNKSINQKKIHDSLIEGYLAYPPLLSFIVSLFPKKYWFAYGKLLNIIFDCLSIVFVYYCSTFIFEYLIKVNSAIISPAFSVALLFSTSPIFFPVSYYARLGRINGGRTISVLFSLLYFTAFGCAFILDIQWCYFICIPIGILIILSSQFGMQYMIFTSILLAIFYLHLYPIIILLCIFLIVILIPKIGARKIIVYKLNHYLWYIKANKQKKSNVWDRNNIKDILLLPYYLFKNVKKFIRLVTKKITFCIIIYSLPIIVVLTVWIIMNPESIEIFTINSTTTYISVLVLSSFITVFLTSLKPLLFLGQAERYLEYSVFFIYLLFVIYLFRYQFNVTTIINLVLMQLFLVFLSFMLKKLSELKKNMLPDDSNEFKELISFLSKKKSLRIISIPTKLNFKVETFLYEKNNKYYYDFIGDKLDGMRYMNEEYSILHYVNTDFNYFKKKYKINTIIVRNKNINVAKMKGIQYKFSGLNKIYANNEYEVYKI